MRGARPSGGRGPERGANHSGDVIGPPHDGVPFGQWPHEGILIDLRQRVFPVRGHGDVGRDGDHRAGGLVRLNQSRQDVGGAAAGRTLADPDPSGDARIPVGHVGGRALIPHEYVPDAVLHPMEGIVEGKGCVAAQAENVVDAICVQHPHKCLGTCCPVPHGKSFTARPPLVLGQLADDAAAGKHCFRSPLRASFGQVYPKG